MEAEGRSYSELYRNSSEEMFLKTLMESSNGVAAPSMESLGLKNISQNFRADSEELFNTWLMNAEASDQPLPFLVPLSSVINITNRVQRTMNCLALHLGFFGWKKNNIKWVKPYNLSVNWFLKLVRNDNEDNQVAGKPNSIKTNLLHNYVLIVYNLSHFCLKNCSSAIVAQVPQKLLRGKEGSICYDACWYLKFSIFILPCRVMEALHTEPDNLLGGKYKA